MSLYRWLLLLHLVGLAMFLLAHGFSAAAALSLRANRPASENRLLLGLSQGSYNFMFGGLLLLVGTGVWMGFLGGWWGHAWLWISIGVLLAVMIVMGALAGAYRAARGAPDEALGEAVAKTRPLTLTWTGAAALAALLFLMVLKPF